MQETDRPLRCIGTSWEGGEKNIYAKKRRKRGGIRGGEKPKSRQIGQEDSWTGRTQGVKSSDRGKKGPGKKIGVGGSVFIPA